MNPKQAYVELLLLCTNQQTYNFMIKKIIILTLCSILALGLSAQKIVQSEGMFFTDATQTKLYTGDYKEYYETGELKLEVNIKEGKPEGSYVVYFKNGKPNEVRAYKDGLSHGVWRTYNEAGILISEAEYLSDKKHGRWQVWDDNGIARYEMHYNNSKRTGTWYMWDEKGKLISEKVY